MQTNTLAERSVLMKLGAGIPGQNRKDRKVTEEVKQSYGLDGAAGRWIKTLWPETALAAIKSKVNEARAYHEKVTLPYGCREEGEEESTPAMAGVGILAGGLIVEYREKMRQLKGELDVLVEEFLADPNQWIEWAKQAHNGTFEPSNYPGCSVDSAGNVSLNEDVFRAKMRKKFYLRCDILPVPNASHFTETMSSLLGVDVESVDMRVRDAETEARREVVRRLIGPVKAMAEKLAEQPKEGKPSPVFRDTLVGNVQDIVRLAPMLNITGDPQIDAFVAEVETLTRFTPDTLRKDGATRSEAAKLAQATLDKLSGYQL